MLTISIRLCLPSTTTSYNADLFIVYCLGHVHPYATVRSSASPHNCTFSMCYYVFRQGFSREVLEAIAYLIGEVDKDLNLVRTDVPWITLMGDLLCCYSLINLQLVVLPKPLKSSTAFPSATTSYFDGSPYRRQVPCYYLIIIDRASLQASQQVNSCSTLVSIVTAH